MKKQAIMVAVMLTALLCASGCGKPADTTSSPVKVTVEAVNNKSLEELHSIYEGTWEVSVVFVDNHDGIQFDADKYQFKEDETGSFIPKNGKREKISWSVTPDGDLKIVLLTDYAERRSIKVCYSIPLFIGADQSIPKNSSSFIIMIFFP